ncbi:MAG: DUF4178 domain-containing protein [Phormidesmis sp. CAN_BIN36]|nr:DUF4178 domain-containing protein [Phormidesmis sp. CAN_BIN36]
MVSTVDETKLRQLQIGDRLRYYGVLWHICDYSTYTDPQGYETEEWLLKSETSKAYYLLREVDPANLEKSVTWYIAEELRTPTIVEPGSLRDLFLELAAEMRSNETPYPELQVFNRVYLFESRTEGTYESDDQTTTRITWDYWDKPHLWNLALEAWSDRRLVVYSTREVQPTDFSDIQHASVGASTSSFINYLNNLDSSDPRTLQIVIASIITIVGLLSIMAGI